MISNSAPNKDHIFLENKKKDDRIVTREFALLFVCRFGYSTVFLMITAIGALFAISAYSVSSAQAGLFVGIFIVAALLSRIFVSAVTAAMGLVRLLRISAVGFFVSILLYAAPISFDLFLMLRFVNGFFFGFLSNAIGALAVFILPQTRMGEGFGYLSLATSLPSALGPFLGLMLCANATFDGAYIACVFFSLLSLIAAFLIQVKAQAADAHATPKTSAKSLTVNQDLLTKKSSTSCKHAGSVKHAPIMLLSAVPICLVLMVAEVLYTGTTSFISLYASSLDAVQAASWFFIAYAITNIIFRPISGKAFDVHGSFVVIVPALLSCVVAYLVLGYASAAWHIVLSGMLLALGRGTIIGIVQPMAVMGVSANKVNAATATFYFFSDAGQGLGPFVAGWFYDLLGEQNTLFYANAACSVLLLLYYLAIHRFFLKD